MNKHTYLISHETMEQQLMVVVECPVRHYLPPVTENKFDHK